MLFQYSKYFYCSGYDVIMSCIQSKLPGFRKSDVPMEWYIGYMFDMNMAKQLKSNLTNSEAYGMYISLFIISFFFFSQYHLLVRTFSHTVLVVPIKLKHICPDIHQ